LPEQRASAMPTIKIHLEQAEYDAVERFANTIAIKPEAVAYARLNRLMVAAKKPDLRPAIVQTWALHPDNLPPGGVSAGPPVLEARGTPRPPHLRMAERVEGRTAHAAHRVEPTERGAEPPAERDLPLHPERAEDGRVQPVPHLPAVRELRLERSVELGPQ